MVTKFFRACLAVVLVTLVLLQAASPQPVLAAASGSGLVAAVNALPQSIGSAPLKFDSALLNLAQTVQPTEILVAPVTVSTPKPDGSIIHPVQFGQALITIAKTYGLTVEELKKRNNLTSDSIFVGQKLIIQGSFTPTISPTISLTPRPPTRTATITRTATLPPSASLTAVSTATATPPPLIPALDNINMKVVGEVILGISAVGLVAVLVSLFIKKKK